MASIGLNYLRYAKIATDTSSATKYEANAQINGAIEAAFTPNIAEASLYADDVLFEYDTQFTDGTLTLGVANADKAIFSALLGETSGTSGTGESQITYYTSKTTDSPSACGVGFIVPIVISGTKKFRVIFFPKVTFKQFNENAKTKGSALEFTTPSVEGKVQANGQGEWKKVADCATQSAAETFLGTLFPTT